MIVRTITIALVAVLLTGCAGKTRLVPQAYMPEPPAILMQAPKELHTIKKDPAQTDADGPKQ
jgi:PBP1b-binding outer membrane lipoprotein LpoB